MKIKQDESITNAGKFFIVGIPGLYLDKDNIEMLERIDPLGVILFARNIDTPEQLANLVKELKSIKTTKPYLISIDFEGGAVNRLRKFLPLMPAARQIADAGRPELAYDFGKISGRILSLFGIDVNFAPVVDIFNPDRNNGIGNRAYSSDPHEVKRWALNYLDGLKSAGIIGCMKHFPGLAETEVDSHDSLPSDNRQGEEIEERDIIPYYHCGSRDIVMVAHCSYPSLLGDDMPASINKNAYDLLKREIGFQGVVFTDDILMGALKGWGDLTELSHKALTAGADAVLICDRLEEAAVAIDQFKKLLDSDTKASALLMYDLKRMEKFFSAKKPCSIPVFDYRVYTWLKEEMEEIYYTVQINDNVL